MSASSTCRHGLSTPCLQDRPPRPEPQRFQELLQALQRQLHLLPEDDNPDSIQGQLAIIQRFHASTVSRLSKQNDRLQKQLRDTIRNSKEHRRTAVFKALEDQLAKQDAIIHRLVQHIGVEKAPKLLGGLEADSTAPQSPSLYPKVDFKAREARFRRAIQRLEAKVTSSQAEMKQWEATLRDMTAELIHQKHEADTLRKALAQNEVEMHAMRAQLQEGGQGVSTSQDERDDERVQWEAEREDLVQQVVRLESAANTSEQQLDFLRQEHRSLQRELEETQKTLEEREERLQQVLEEYDSYRKTAEASQQQDSVAAQEKIMDLQGTKREEMAAIRKRARDLEDQLTKARKETEEAKKASAITDDLKRILMEERDTKIRLKRDLTSAQHEVERLTAAMRSQGYEWSQKLDAERSKHRSVQQEAVSRKPASALRAAAEQEEEVPGSMRDLENVISALETENAELKRAFIAAKTLLAESGGGRVDRRG
ncbi:unnamed protein product [Vitrella brassicaformis CCMP3155]|uniref:Uncharacterized protein n=2 Tax=Vitrella brassicaformis TaxID=1169539 RepID=A0A0G4EAF0_VITBC|nr:unnamed protein product [Vitrella brassicaformis CCMP3155]|eukprot:CEL92450.1 unnamed protein product [Vitrella brassicaformis CCMP3155]